MDEPDSFADRKRALLEEVRQQLAEATRRAEEVRESTRRLEDTLDSFVPREGPPPRRPLDPPRRRRGPHEP